jgi:methyl-accepting chemotaxis protein
MTDGGTDGATARDGDRRARTLGTAAQAAGVVGIVVCLVLAATLLLVRGRLVDRVGALGARVDSAITSAVPLLDRAQSRVDQLSAGVGEVATAAQARAEQPGQVTTTIQALLDRAATLSQRYLELRESYAEARDRVSRASEALDAVDRLIPGISVPPGPGEALQDLDQRLQELDAKVMGLIAAIPSSDAVQPAAAVAAKAQDVQSSIDGLSARFDAAKARLQSAQAEVASLSDTAQTAITITTVLLVVVLLYLAFLHWVLFRTGRTLRRGPPGT